MKKFALYILPIIALCLTSCNKEGKQPDANRAFNTKAVALCKSYLGMKTEAAAAKMQEDWDYTTAYWPTYILCSPGDETITANLSDGVVSRVSYSRHFTNWTQKQVYAAAAAVCPAVAEYFTQTNPTIYNGGMITLNDGTGFTYTDHSSFMQKFNEETTNIAEASEYWGSVNFSVLSQKNWSFYCNGSDASISFKLDTSKQ